MEKMWKTMIRNSVFSVPKTGLTLMFAFGCFASVPVVAQNAGANVKGKATSKDAMPRTPDGHPDFQGLWDYATSTPLQRPADLEGKERFLDQKEADEWARSRSRRVGGGPNGFRDYDPIYTDRGTVVKTLRTSLIIDPPDGKLPAFTEEAKKRLAERDARNKGHEADGPEYRSLQEQCLVIVGSGAPIMPSVYDNLLRIVQTPDFIAMETEMNHEPRVVRMDRRPHLPSKMRFWQGDSRGRWEGDTLVIETTNFITMTLAPPVVAEFVSDITAYRGTDRDLKLTERFRWRDADSLLYQFTVDDPTTFVRPWTAELVASKAEGPMLEYACHEGNYALTGILAGARAEEKKTK